MMQMLLPKTVNFAEIQSLIHLKIIIIININMVLSYLNHSLFYLRNPFL